MGKTVVCLDTFLKCKMSLIRNNLHNSTCPELCSSSPSCCYWMNQLTTWTWTPVCGWRRSSNREFAARVKSLIIQTACAQKYKIGQTYGSLQIQENPCAHLALSRLPEWSLYQHYPPSSEETEILHGKNSGLKPP